MMFVQKNSNTSNLSLEALKAYAQTGGENGEEGEGGGENSTCPEGQDKGIYVDEKIGDGYIVCTIYGKQYVCDKWSVTFECSETGSDCGICGYNEELSRNCTYIGPC